MRHCDKVVACVLIDIESSPKILVFEHPPPLSDFQIPKGTIEANEDPIVAVLRELEEESGLSNCNVVGRIGSFDLLVPGGHYGEPEQEAQTWYAYHIQLLSTPKNHWIYRVTGSGIDSGLDYRYFWFNLNDKSIRFHAKFEKLLELVRSYLERI